MAILQNGAVSYQPIEQGLSDSLLLSKWGINQAQSPFNARGDVAQKQYANDDYTRRLQEKQMRDLEMQAIMQKMAGSSGPSRTAGIGSAPQRGPRGGKSPHEQEQEGRSKSQRDFKLQRQQEKQMREDERLHMNNLLNDYERYQSKGKAKPGGMNGSSRSGGGGDTGYTEQIFNNAGAPQVVKLNYQKPNESAAMEQDAILKIIMGAMR